MNIWETFVESVARHFHFLETEFEFEHKSVKEPFVIYQSKELEVIVFYDVGRRHELDLGIKRIGDDVRKIPSIGISEIIRLVDMKTRYLSPFPSNEMSIEVEVQRLASLLKKYGTELLKNNAYAFERIYQLRQEMAAKLRRKIPPSDK